MFVLVFLVIFLSRMHCWWDRLNGPGRDVRPFLVLLVEGNKQDHAFGLVALAIQLALLWQRTITVCQTKRTGDTRYSSLLVSLILSGDADFVLLL